MNTHKLVKKLPTRRLGRTFLTGVRPRQGGQVFLPKMFGGNLNLVENTMQGKV